MQTLDFLDSISFSVDASEQPKVNLAQPTTIPPDTRSLALDINVSGAISSAF